MSEAIDGYFRGMLNKIQTCLIARVEQVHSDTGFIDATPLAESKGVPLPRKNKIPVGYIGNQGFNIKMNVAVGDIVILLIASQDISNWVTNEDIKPNTNKRHNLNNALAIPFWVPTDITPSEIPREIQINGSGTWTGNIVINGNVTINGTSTADDHISSGISGKDHLHSGVTTGSGKTGKPEG